MGVWQEVGDRVFVRRYPFYDQGIGAVLGDDGVLVIDTRTTHRQGQEILDDLRELTRLPVSLVVNTHYHYDHTFGNAVFRPAPVWGHERCASVLRASGERMRDRVVAELPDDLAAEVRAVVIDPPGRTLTVGATLDVGGRAVELRYLGRGHTDSDIIVAVAHAGVLFAGDLLENGAPPYFGDSFPLDWPGTVERLLPLATGAVVPGHGDVADRGFVEHQLADLRAVAALARRAHTQGLTVDDVLSSAPWGGAPNVREALERGLAQLRGELD